MKMKVKNLINCIVFLILVFIIVIWLGNISRPNEQEYYKEKLEYYNELQEDSIDITFIGNSTTYRYINVMQIWDEYDVTSMLATSPGMPFEAVLPLMEFTLTTQSPDVFVIDLRSLLKTEYSIATTGTYEEYVYENTLNNALISWPNSISRVSTILNTDYISDDEKIYRIFDVLYYHDNFLSQVFDSYEALPYKGNHLSFKIKDMSLKHVDISNIEPNEYELSDEIKEYIDEICDYADEQNVNVFFTFTPYVGLRVTNDVDIRNAIGEYITDKGFVFEDYKEQFDDISFDLTQDFYNSNHTNYYGAIKFTPYIMDDILEAFPIDSTHDPEVVDNWNQDYEAWVEYVEEEVNGN